MEQDVNKLDHVSNLTFEMYQQATEKTAIYRGKGTVDGLVYCALGLGEAGEVQNKVKKILRDTDGKVTEEIRQKILGELGDLLWYVSQACSELHTDMCSVAFDNLEKLRSRQERGVLKGDGDSR